MNNYRQYLFFQYLINFRKKIMYKRLLGLLERHYLKSQILNMVFALSIYNSCSYFNVNSLDKIRHAIEKLCIWSLLSLRPGTVNHQILIQKRDYYGIKELL